MNFTITLVAVAVMLLYAVPGYLMMKTKLVSADTIPAFAKLLLYVCQPCLIVYTFTKTEFSMKFLGDWILFFLVTLFLQIFMLVLFSLIFKKKSNEVKFRIFTVATAMGNIGFFGVPLLEAVLPEYPEAVAFSTAFTLSMNLLSWTVASAIITRDKKYISLKKVVFNPAFLSILVALPIFITGFQFPVQINDMITLLGKMTTPLCMIIMGMRLATVKVKSMFNQPLQYLAVLVKQVAYPLLALALISLFDVDAQMKQTLFILCCCPIASMVLNFAEVLGEGQENAANDVLLGTAASVLTIPLMLLLF